MGSILFHGDHFSQLRRSLTCSKTRSMGALIVMLLLTLISLGRRKEKRIRPRRIIPIQMPVFLRNLFMIVGNCEVNIVKRRENVIPIAIVSETSDVKHDHW